MSGAICPRSGLPRVTGQTKSSLKTPLTDNQARIAKSPGMAQPGHRPGASRVFAHGTRPSSNRRSDVVASSCGLTLYGPDAKWSGQMNGLAMHTTGFLLHVCEPPNSYANGHCSLVFNDSSLPCDPVTQNPLQIFSLGLETRLSVFVCFRPPLSSNNASVER